MASPDRQAQREYGTRMIAKIRSSGVSSAEQDERIAELLGKTWAYAKKYGDALEMIRSHLRDDDMDGAWREAGEALAAPEDRWRGDEYLAHDVSAMADEGKAPTGIAAAQRLVREMLDRRAELLAAPVVDREAVAAIDAQLEGFPTFMNPVDQQALEMVREAARIVKAERDESAMKPDYPEPRLDLGGTL